MADFKIYPDCVWTKPDNFKVLLKIPDDDEQLEDELDEDFEDAQETIVEDDDDDEDMAEDDENDE